MLYVVHFFDDDFHFSIVKSYKTLKAAKSYCVRNSISLSGRSHYSIVCYRENGRYCHSYYCDNESYEFVEFI